ncbi:MAG TPA: type II toxin-antitoxin system RelE/ParE family toxin [Thermoleophilia bacterium]|nr:type II toxin-antitoxin system RelE/ParE family toxin [Thermoleophilia bacterium]
MIRSFRDADTERVFDRRGSTRLPPDVCRTALKKLLMIDAAESLLDLRVPPGNRLERLSGDRRERYSIRINDQWRICFRWKDGDALDVEIVDYH